MTYRIILITLSTLLIMARGLATEHPTATGPKPAVMTSQIEILVWHDSNGDGQMQIGSGDECGEDPLDMDQAAFNLLLNGSPTTDADGNPIVWSNVGGGIYRAENLAAGTGYQVEAIIGIWQATQPDYSGSVDDIVDIDDDSDFVGGLSQTFDLVDGITKTNVDLGLWQYMTVGGFVFRSPDCSQCEFVGDPMGNAAPDAEVVLIDEETGLVLSTTTTAIDGTYAFANVAPGDYTILLAPSNFAAGNHLEVYLPLPPCGNPNDDRTNRNDASGTTTASIQISPVILRSGCEPSAGGQENKTFDIGVCFEFDCTDTNQDYLAVECDETDPTNPSHNPFFPICDLFILDNFCSSLPDLATSNGPTQLCSGGSPQNIAWMSFVAGEGTYRIEIASGNCLNVNGRIGMEAGIYTDCSFSEAVICSSGCSTAPISLGNRDTGGTYVLIPGKVYYLYMNGCNGSTCEFEMDIIGNFIPFEPAAPTGITCSSSDTTVTCLGGLTQASEQITFTLQGIDIDDISYNWSITPDDGGWSVVDPNPIDPLLTNKNTITVAFEPTTSQGSYDVCWTNLTSKCYDLTSPLCITVEPILDPTDLRYVIGVAFADEDGDGIQGPAELGLANVQVGLSSGRRGVVLTDTQGKYVLPTFPDLHRIKAAVPYGSWESDTIVSPILDLLTDTLASYDFAFKPVPVNVIDRITTSISHEPIRCNTSPRFRPIVVNDNEQAVTVILEVYMDTLLRNMTSTTPSDSLIDNTAYYSVTLGPGEMFRPEIRGDLAGPEAIGEAFDMTVIAIALPSGAISTSSRVETFRCGYDPNDKLVTPQTIDADNYVLNGTTLSYTIRFQNTGNDFAEDVELIDILDPNVDPTSIAVLSSSHAVLTRLLGDTLTFRFEDIFLIDSTTDAAASQGYVTFTADLLPDLAVGTTIRNTAAIYFDLNPPIITNTVVNTIIDVLPCTTTRYSYAAVDICRADLSGDLSSYTQSGSYRDTLTTSSGCDSVRLLELTILPEQQVDLGSIDICEDSTIELGGIQISESGNYFFKDSDINGCDSVSFVSITVQAGDVTIFSELLICPGDSVEVLGAWYDAPVSISDTVTNATGCDSILVYSVALLDADDPSCAPLATIEIIEPAIKLYPNPAQQTLYVEIDHAAPHAYEVLSIHGQMLLRGVGSQISLEALGAGCYLLRVRDDTGRPYVRRFVKQ